MPLIRRLLRGTGSDIHIDPDYSTRRGYESEFLGSGEHAVPLPSLPDELVPLAATNGLATSEPKYLLPYHHFTVVMNKKRRLAIFTAVNIDGKLQKKPTRQEDHWFFDPRVPEDEQTGKGVYEKNPLDLGHLVPGSTPRGAARERRQSSPTTTRSTSRTARLSTRTSIATRRGGRASRTTS